MGIGHIFFSMFMGRDGVNVGFQKISIPSPRRELDIPEGWGVKDPGNSGGEGGWTIDLVSRCPSIQYGFRYRSRCSKILSYLLSRSFA